MTTQKTLHIAWTVDDGPTPYTASMVNNFPGSKRPATWYIVRDRLSPSMIFLYRNL